MDADTSVTIAVVLIGTGVVATGSVGLRLRASDRLASLLALVVGAGVGVAALAVGLRLSSHTPEGDATALLVASALGLAATLASLAVLWRSAGT